MLSVDKLNVFYENFQALNDVNLSVKDGETLCLVGPNGHGKTTILKTISGLLKPRSGRIVFANVDITTLPPHEIVRRGVVYVPEGGLFPNMTVLENLKLGAYTEEASKHRGESLKLVFKLFPRLDERKKQTAWTLSGGERRMASIGRGLMSHAKLLMLDEPSFGLAPKLIMEVYDTIKSIKQTGISLIVVEQNFSYIADVADNVSLIEEGKTALEGSFQDFVEDPHVKEVYFGR
jgi:branched-chain amino acid transport system ATP-binding protein